MTKELKREFEKLPDDAKWHLQKCDGYIDLKLYDRAKAELRHIAPAHRTSIFYQQLKLRIAIETEDWKKALPLAIDLCEKHPEYQQFWIHWAYALRRVEGLEAAHVILTKAKIRFPKEGLILFNLACYECQLGKQTEAKKHLKQAFKIDRAFISMALEDDDLKPLWPYLEKEFGE